MEIHPLAELIPTMTEDEFAELQADIEKNGLQVPVTLYEDKVLDGRHRARACEALGIHIDTQVYAGDDPAEHVISLNLARRHLTTGQRAAAALKLLDWEREEARERQASHGAAPGRPAKNTSHQVTGSVEDPAPDPPHSREAVAKAGEKFGVSGASVERAKTVAEKRPDLLPKVESGELTVAAAANIAKGKEKPPPKPLDLSSERNRQRAEKQLGRLWTVINMLAGFEEGMKDFDLRTALAAASDEDAEEMDRMLDGSRKAIVQLRSDIKRQKGL